MEHRHNCSPTNICRYCWRSLLRCKAAIDDHQSFGGNRIAENEHHAALYPAIVLSIHSTLSCVPLLQCGLHFLALFYTKMRLLALQTQNKQEEKEYTDAKLASVASPPIERNPSLTDRCGLHPALQPPDGVRNLARGAAGRRVMRLYRCPGP